MSRLTLEVNSDSHSLECITFFKLCHLLQMNLQLAKKSHPLSHPSTKLNSFHLWQSWELPTGTHWWVATHSMGTNFNLLLISYCVCLALQTSDCLTCTSVHSGANIKQPMKKKNSCIAKIFTKPCRHLFWSIYFMVQKKRTAESFQTTQCSVSQNCT